MSRGSGWRRGRALARSLGLLIFAALVAIPSGAALAAAPNGSFSGPAEGSIVRVAPPQIAGDYSQPDGIVTRINLTLRSLGGRGAPGASLEVPGNGAGQLVFNWAPALAYNGPYEVSATGTGEDRPVDANGPETSAAITRRFAMEVPPVVPADVRVAVAKDTRFVRVSWRVNPEPDLVGYQVQRSKDGGSFASAGETASTSLVDEATAQAGGEYRYRVVALRLGATDQNVITSGFSSVEAVQVAPPPTTTTTSEPSGEGGGATTTTVTGGGTKTNAGRAAPVSGSSRIDLSAFAALLDQRRTAPSTPVEEIDGGFAPTLPFAPPTDEEKEEEGDPGFDTRQIPVPQALAEDSTADRFKNLAILAGGLLAFVIAMNLIYVVGEANRAVELEAVPPLGHDAFDTGADTSAPSIEDLVLAGAAATVPELASVEPEPGPERQPEPEPAAEVVPPGEHLGEADRVPSRRDRLRAYVFGTSADVSSGAGVEGESSAGEEAAEVDGPPPHPPSQVLVGPVTGPSAPARPTRPGVPGSVLTRPYLTSGEGHERPPGVPGAATRAAARQRRVRRGRPAAGPPR